MRKQFDKLSMSSFSREEVEKDPKEDQMKITYLSITVNLSNSNTSLLIPAVIVQLNPVCYYNLLWSHN